MKKPEKHYEDQLDNYEVPENVRIDATCKLTLRERFANTSETKDWSFEENDRPLRTRILYRRIRVFGIFSYRPQLVFPMPPENSHESLN